VAIDIYQNPVSNDCHSSLLGLIKFDCFKSYEESTTYLKEENAVRFGFLYHYATLQFKPNLLPKLSKDGNYYDLPEALGATCGDIWSTSTDILISNYRLRTRIESIIESNDPLLTDIFLLNLGFAPVNMSMMYGKGTQVTKPA
jgi:hypothetical protein